MVQISWRDARSFCAWLSEATARSFRLPIEAEWEKTARVTDGRTYPWGDRPPTTELCNYDMQVGHTNPVGQYSKNVSRTVRWTWQATSGSGQAAFTGPIRIKWMMAEKIQRLRAFEWCGVGP